MRPLFEQKPSPSPDLTSEGRTVPPPRVGALSFDAVAPKQPTASRPAAGAPLAFPPKAKPTPRAAPVGNALFSGNAHPATTAAFSVVASLDPVLADRSPDVVNREINRLIPVKHATLVQYADRTLETAAGCTQETGALTAALANLNAAKVLDEIAAAALPKTSLLAKIKAKLDLAPSEQELRALSVALRGLAHDAGELEPEVVAIERKLALKLTVLRAVEQSLGQSGGDLELDAISRKGDLLRAALLQSQLVIAQLRQLRKTLVSLDASCDRVRHVILPARQN